MKYRFLRDVILSASMMFILTITPFVVSSATSRTASEDTTLIGAWEGVLDAQGFQLRIVFHISTTDDAALTAVMDSPDQGVTGIPVDEVDVQGDHLRLCIISARGTYEGDLQEDGTSIEGNITQGGTEMPVVLDLVDAYSPERQS